ncbi:MAG: aldose 1-epimerase family protein, partial [Vallitaleaceae bacterium]|nr:aldose 1-epimerase family protein [Vallitaleaceae bacterium]
MQIYKIENDQLKIQINSMGAELDSIYNKNYQLEYLWNADPAFWPKKSPVLFPIVGTLKNDEYYFQNRSFKMGRHGFVREKEFEVAELSPENLKFSLQSNEETLKQYPFDFLFDVIYSITGNCLKVTYQVTNTGTHVMYFSVGGHPAFMLPLEAATVYEDYFLEFSAIENAGRWPISKDGLIEGAPVPLLVNTNILPLNKQLFQQDALVFKDLRSDKVSLRS